MTWVGAAFILVGFLVLARLMRVPARATEVVQRSRRALADLRNHALSDLEKERAMQEHSRRLFSQFLLITASTAVALAVPVGIVALLDAAGVMRTEEVLAATVSWPFIAGATVLGVVALVAARMRRPVAPDASFLNAYGLFDRVLHRVAFATQFPQAAVADMEDRMFRRSLAALDLGPPVLITGLPRAGTTILLEMLAAMPTFACHTYRDMPFILCPMLWNQISRPFQKPGAARRRAHDDGIEISPDSPEAFEEVVWMRFWRDHYRPDSITPWDHCKNEEFAEFFSSHMRKIVALRARVKPAARRYASKNNLNIARIPAIWEADPDAIVIVPFRDPLQHAASLIRQHRRFTELHAQDPFARRYMAAIGHFDFGANLRPVNFDGWLDSLTTRDPNRLQFWVEYWLATYRHVLRHRDEKRLFLLCDEALTATADVAPLALALELPDAQELRARQHILKPTRDHVIGPAEVSAEIVTAARAVYEEMRGLSVL